MPKIGNYDILGHSIFQGKPNILRLQLYIYVLPIEIRHNVHMQYHGNYIEVKIINYMLEFDTLRNFPQKQIGSPKGCFSRVRVSK